MLEMCYTQPQTIAYYAIFNFSVRHFELRKSGFCLKTKKDALIKCDRM